MSPTTSPDRQDRPTPQGRPQDMDVAAYVAAVRARLDDLEPEESEELTTGLEADLTEALAGYDEPPAERFGDPAAYADELRASAGLPPRPEAPEDNGLVATIEAARRDIVAAVDEHLLALERLPWYGPVREFLHVLLPAWWVLRAWVAVAAVRQGLNADETGIVGGAPSFVVLVLAVVASVTIGRRSPLRSDTGRALLLVGNVVAVMALLLVLPQYAEPPSDAYVEPPSGLVMNGQPVQDVIPYDAQGRLLHDVSLYDDQGRPLEIGQDFRWYSDDGTSPHRWNVYPIVSQEPTPANTPAASLTTPPPATSATPSPTATPANTPTPQATPTK